MKKSFSQKRFMFMSPWLIAAPIGLMTLIIAVFASNNLHREVKLINDGLFLRGQSLAKFVGAGTRASIMQGMGGAVHTQRLIEQASEEKDIIYIAVLDHQGVIMAHSQPELVNSVVNRDFEGDRKPGKGSWHIIVDEVTKKNVFEVVSEFSPFRHRGRGPNRLGHKPDDRRRRRPDLENNLNDQRGQPNDWCRLMENNSNDSNWQGKDFIILVGLDMSEQERITSQARLHIILLSVILLFIGLGGWFTMLVSQSYRASQESLKHIQAFTSLLIMKLPVGIIATEQDGNITTYNKAVAAMTGLSPEKVINRKPGRILPKILADFFDELDMNDEVLEKEISLACGANDLIVHVSSVPVVDHDNIPAGRVLLLHDMTELKKLEKEVMQHDRLVALGKMAAGVAHEVRNPLSSIKGFATLLQSKHMDGTEEHKAAKLMISEVERLNRSITELLNYSRPLPLECKKVDLKNILEQSIDLMKTDALELGIDLSVEVEPELPMVNVDADRIKQVLLNLLLNAFQAIEGGGSVNLQAYRKNGSGMVELIVKDSGCGIEPENIERIMDPYFTTKASGTGLGLALVYKIIDEHGGSIRFFSQPEQGTSVFVNLPVASGVNSTI